MVHIENLRSTVNYQLEFVLIHSGSQFGDFSILVVGGQLVRFLVRGHGEKNGWEKKRRCHSDILWWGCRELCQFTFRPRGSPES